MPGPFTAGTTTDTIWGSRGDKSRELMWPRSGAAFSFSLQTTRAPVGATLRSQHHSARCGRLAERPFKARHTDLARKCAKQILPRDHTHQPTDERLAAVSSWDKAKPTPLRRN
jgi:hypothetical protein